MPPFDIRAVRRVLAGSLPVRPDPVAPRAAAVAAIFRQGTAGLEVLFIERSQREGDPWSGHMAFPGGRREAHDHDLLATAVRETLEEVGLDLTRAAELVGALEDQDATGRGSRDPLPIRPFVFELTGDPRFALSGEVHDVIWAPVEALLSGSSHTTVTVDHRGQTYEMPGWDLGGRIVWGLTYRMVSTVVGLVGP